MSLRPVMRALFALLVLGYTTTGIGTGTALAGGFQFLRTDHYTQAPDDSESRELWLLAETITVEGHLAESLFGAANSAELSGHYAKDVWISAKQITLGGNLSGSARLVARNSILADGQVESSLMALAGRTIRLDPEFEVRHDALLMANDVMLQGQIGGNTAIWAKRAVISGKIDGNLFVSAEEISILRGTHIGGDLVYAAARELELDHHIHVGGAIQRRALPSTGMGPGQHIMVQLFLYMGALISGLIFIALFPRYTGCAVRRIRHQFWSSTLAGSLAFFLIPATILLALFSVVGIPAGLLMAGAYAILLYLAKIVVALAIGGILLQRRGQQPYFATALTLALGLLLLYVLALMPRVGGIVTILVLFIGLGGLTLGIVDMQRKKKPPPLREGREFTEIRTRDALSNKP